MEFLPSIFERLPESDIRAALEVFTTLDVDANCLLIEEGDVDPTLVVVQAGELVISTGDTLLGRAGIGQIVGEMALFGDGMRTASVAASVPTRLLVLDALGYTALRNSGNPVAAALEEHALNQLTDRLRVVGDRVASIAYGSEQQDFTPAPGFFNRVATALGSGGMLYPGRVDSVAVLRGSPLFKGVPESILVDVAQHFYPVAARSGHFLCTEGESGNDMFILRDGLVDVIVATQQSDRFERLATLEQGDAFGMGALLQNNYPRMASCICREQVVGLSMGRITWAELICRNDMVGSVLRGAMIRALGDQLAYANAQLSLLDMQRQQSEKADRQYEHVMRAAAAMEAHGRFDSDTDIPSYLA